MHKIEDILTVSVKDLNQGEKDCAEIVRITESDPWSTKVKQRPKMTFRGQKVKFEEGHEEGLHPKFVIEQIGGDKPMQVRLKIQIGKLKLRACIDTGASRSLMSLEQWKQLASPGLKIRPANVALVACGSKPIKVHGSERITFKVEGNKQPYVWPFIISDSWSPHHDCILGVDFLMRVGAKIDLLSKEIIFQKKLESQSPEHIGIVDEDSRVPLRTRDEIVVAPYSGRWVSGIIEWPDQTEPKWQGSGLYESAISYGRRVTISEALVNVVEDKTTVWAENRTPHEYLIPQGQVLGWLSEKDEVDD